VSHGRLASTTAALTAAVLLTAAAPAHAGRGREALVGSSCALLNLVYGPAKLTYALLGGLVGGIAFAVSAGDREVAEPILDASLRGDYAISPDHLTGRRELEFFGRSEAQRRARAHAGGGASPSPRPGDEPSDAEW
jgi:hypothetical protein